MRSSAAHRDGCNYMPSDKTWLGVFASCHDAVRAAKSHYSQVNGCRFCSTPCHTQ